MNLYSVQYRFKDSKPSVGWTTAQDSVRASSESNAGDQIRNRYKDKKDKIVEILKVVKR